MMQTQPVSLSRGSLVWSVKLSLENGHRHLWIDNQDLGKCRTQNFCFCLLVKWLMGVAGGGSVISNTLNHGARYILYREYFSIHCGIEVVLPSGEIMRTGIVPKNNTWQLFQYGRAADIAYCGP
jgi:hypothetical protein